MEQILMECGHVARARINQTKEPFCPVCFCSTKALQIPDLTNRIARCYNFGHEVVSKLGRMHFITCRGERPSSLDLPFFYYKPNDTYDQFYCGCDGWD